MKFNLFVLLHRFQVAGCTMADSYRARRRFVAFLSRIRSYRPLDRSDSQSITHLAVSENEHRRKEQPIHYTNQVAAFEEFRATGLETFSTEDEGLQSLGLKFLTHGPTIPEGGFSDISHGIQVVGSWDTTGVPSSRGCKDSRHESDNVDGGRNSERSRARQHRRLLRSVCSSSRLEIGTGLATIRRLIDASSGCYLSMRMLAIYSKKQRGTRTVRSQKTVLSTTCCKSALVSDTFIQEE